MLRSKDQLLSIKICTLLCLVVLFLTTSFNNAVGYIPIYISVPIWFLIITWAIICKPKINLRLLSCFGIVALLYFISSIVTGFESFRVIKYLLSFTAVVLILNAYPIQVIKRAYVNCILIISCISLILFPLVLSFPTAFERFVQQGTGLRRYYNLFLFVHCIGSDRNCGMFWEPGAFAPFIVFALAILILEKNEGISRRYLKILILIITLITTFSTTGYITMAICVSMILFDSDSSRLKKIGFLLVIISVISLGLYYFSDSIFSSYGYTTFGKLYGIFENRYYLSVESNNSSTVRLYSVIIPFEICFNNPIFGVGYVNLQQMTLNSTRGAITCTFSNWFGMHGLLYGIIVFIGYVRFSWMSCKITINRILLTILMLFSIMTEDFSGNAIILGISILGLIMDKEEKTIRLMENT